MMYFWTPERLRLFIVELVRSGYIIAGPKIRDGAIIYDEIKSLDELPKGWTEVQAPGSYQIKKRDDDAYLGYVVGPHSWKKFLHPPKEVLWTAKKTKDGIQLQENKPSNTKMAFLGVRSCDLAAIQILDKVFYNNSNYKIRREDNLIIAVNCTESASTCFCTSMNTGPKAKKAFDISLTEIIGEGFVVEVGTELGHRWVKKIEAQAATKQQVDTAESLINNCAVNMEKKMDVQGIKELLYENLNSPVWDDISKTCLTCANCTMVCPTCFCSSVEDHTNLAGTETSHLRKWDSCFNAGHSYVHGGSVHGSTSSRYRQWMTHKLASWQDQYDSSGCTGCGRCVSWCPVGIDITENIKNLRAKSKR